ncbi:hypothetical protein Q7P37_010530 [Cladosporium fusiforme]
MAASSNYARLREQTMGSQFDEEAVTVNTRALIDKVLARYSGEWTTLRELIQNAADAQATRVTIRFETNPSASVPLPQSQDKSEHIKHVLLHHTLKTLMVSNNGETFVETDWQRLKRIAEGNPDETKIGAFGVGFYSVFADCESPFVSSGNQNMAFYWKKDSLFTRRGKLPDDQASKDTTFLLDYRSSTTPVPQLLSLCQFLATSLTFVGLECIELFLDDWNILKLTKKMAPGANVDLPKDIDPKTKDGLMKITAVEYQNAQIDAQWMNVVGWNRQAAVAAAARATQPQAESSGGSLRSWFSKLAGGVNSSSSATKKAEKEEEALQLAIAEDLTGYSNATVFLRISTVSVQTFIGRSLAAELERATKKPPPKHTRIAILTSSYDETSASLSTVSGAGSKKASEIFASVQPKKNGKIFIGFPTAQTTGLLAHISAPSVIPTVERESIDLNARYVRDWNVEMLRVAGIACRVAYTGEMAELKAKLDRAKSVNGTKAVSKEDVAAVMPSAIHAFKQYTYEESTPSSRVGACIEEAFWMCSRKASIDILSTRGVLPSQQARVASEDLSFVEGIPVVPDELMTKASEFITKLRDYGLLSDITTSDIKRELEAQALTEKQVVELLKWACTKTSRQSMDASEVQSLFDGTVAGIDEEFIGLSSSPVIQLGQIRNFVNTSKIPAELPAPPHTMPFRLTKGLTASQLSSIGWEELQIVPWLRWIVESNSQGFGPGQTFETSPNVASQILPVISKSWEGLSQSSKQTVADLLVPRTVIPTKLGMRKPPQSYFASVKLFDDLPTITGLQGVKEKFLGSLGVRKTIELTVVFDRLMAKSATGAAAGEARWSHHDLVKYLVSVKDDIPAEDIKRLRNTPICPAEPLSGDQVDKGKLYRLDELFEPSDEIRRLALPVIQWPGQWKPASPEGRFLRTLGLLEYPDVPMLVNILNEAPATSDLQKAALNYFIQNSFRNGYDRYPMQKIDKAFLPVQAFPGEGNNMIAKPTQCYANRKAAVMKFRILQADLIPHHALFGVALDPPIEICAERLIRAPPLDIGQAKTLFGYFADRLAEIGPSGHLAEKLGNAPIVPLIQSKGEKTPNVRFVAPRLVFLGNSEVYGDIFDFVDFGQEANSFLMRVGTKQEPTATEIAYMLVREPGRLLEKLGSEKYLQLLRRIAEYASSLKKDGRLWQQLKHTPCLLAVKEVAKAGHGDIEKVRDPEEEDLTIKEYSLTNAQSMVIVDDFHTFRLFQSTLLAAPQEEALEGLYAALETPHLSKLVQDDQRKGSQLRDQAFAQKLQRLIVERSRLFLHDHSADTIRHDAKWLEQNMTVEGTEFLQVTHRLRGYQMQYLEKRTAALHRETKRDAILFVTAKYDLYEVSRSIMSLLLKKPRQQDYLALEMLMDSDLRRLKAKGYNVDRILRRKAEESRIAETERQKREEEQRKIAEANAKANAGKQPDTKSITNGMGQLQLENNKTPEKQPSMPGSFDSPEQQPLRPESSGRGGKKPGNLFSNISRQLGFNNDPPSPQHPHVNNMLTNGQGGGPGPELPPPYSQGKPSTSGPSNGQVTSPMALQQNLQSAIKASRSYNADSLFSRPQTNNIREAPTYCDNKPGHDLAFVRDLDQGIKFFLSRQTPNHMSYFKEHQSSLASFVVLLRQCAAIFDLPVSTVNIFADEQGATIAFNQSGSLFCNLRFFEQLHSQNMGSPEGLVEAMSYWWITLCHELAHNLVGDHGPQHSFYTESFAHHYFPRMVWWASTKTNLAAQ